MRPLDRPDEASLVVFDTPAGATVAIRVIPRAGGTRLAGVRHGALVVRLAAAPVDGAANDTLLKTLATALHLPRHRVRLASGARSREKRVDIAGVRAADVRRQLTALVGQHQPRSRGSS